MLKLPRFSGRLFGVAALALVLLLSFQGQKEAPIKAQSARERLSPIVPVTSPAMIRVASALAWLADHQSDGGYWNPEYFYKDSVRIGVEAVVDGNDGQVPFEESISHSKQQSRIGAGRVESAEACTALGLLAYLRTGSDMEKGPYSKNVRDAALWLVSRQDKDGSFSRQTNIRGQEVKGWRNGHALALIALSELQAIYQLEMNKDAIRRGSEFAISLSNEKIKGWGLSKTAAKADPLLTPMMALALAKARLSGAAPSVNDALQEQIDDWLLAAEAEKAAKHTVGGKIGFPVETVGNHHKSPTAFTLNARLTSGRLKPQSGHADAQAQGLIDLRAGSINQPMVGAFGLGPADDASHIKALAWTTPLYEALRRSQRGFMDKEIGRFHAAGSPRGRESLDEHGSWDPKGAWSKYGGRVMSTALNTLTMIKIAEIKKESTDLSKIDTDAGGKLVPWDGSKVNLEGVEDKDAQKAFWRALLKQSRDWKDFGSLDRYDLVDGNVESVDAMYIEAFREIEDPSTMAKSAGGEIAVEYVYLGANGRETRFYLPMRGEEWLSLDEGKTYQRAHEEAIKAARYSDPRELVGPRDPRFPWNEVVWTWYQNLDADKSTWLERCGASLWFAENYSRYQWASPDDSGHAVWNGYAEEILIDAQRFGGALDEYVLYVASYERQDPELEKSSTKFYLDTFLTPDQQKIREGLSANGKSFLSWYDAYFLKRRKKQTQAVRDQPAVTALRDQCRAERAKLIDQIRLRVLSAK